MELVNKSRSFIFADKKIGTQRTGSEYDGGWLHQSLNHEHQGSLKASLCGNRICG